MDSTLVSVQTGHGPRIADLSDVCRGFLEEIAGGESGLLVVFVPHATAGVAILELGSGSEADLQEALDRLLPRDDRWRHAHGSPGHGADHVLPAFVAPSASIPVLSGRMALGTWQSVALVDLSRDNPRRSVRLSFLRG